MQIAKQGEITMYTTIRNAIAAALLLAAAAYAAPLPGQIIVDPDNPAFLVHNRDSDKDGKLDPFYMCGPGDPEGYLYMSNSRQKEIINKMKGTGANCLYITSYHCNITQAAWQARPAADSPRV